MGPGFAAIGAGAITATGYFARGKKPPAGVFIGAGIAGVALLVIAQGSPQVASRFGTLIVLTALLTSGVDVARGINRAIGQPATTTTTAPAPAAD